MENPTKTDPQHFAPDKMHDPREAIHFVAAQELMILGRLTPQTVELLCTLAPQPITSYEPPVPGASHGKLTVGFAGAGAVMSKDVPIDAAADAMSGGKVQIKAEDEITIEITIAMRNRLQRLMTERNAAVAAHIKVQQDKAAARKKLN